MGGTIPWSEIQEGELPKHLLPLFLHCEYKMPNCLTLMLPQCPAMSCELKSTLSPLGCLWQGILPQQEEKELKQATDLKTESRVW